MVPSRGDLRWDHREGLPRRRRESFRRRHDDGDPLEQYQDRHIRRRDKQLLQWDHRRSPRIQSCPEDRKGTRPSSSHGYISYAVLFLRNGKPHGRRADEGPEWKWASRDYYRYDGRNWNGWRGEGVQWRRRQGCRDRSGCSPSAVDDGPLGQLARRTERV